MSYSRYSQAFLALAVGQEDASTPSLKVTVDAGSILSNWGGTGFIGGVGWVSVSITQGKHRKISDASSWWKQ